MTHFSGPTRPAPGHPDAGERGLPGAVSAAVQDGPPVHGPGAQTGPTAGRPAPGAAGRRRPRRRVPLWLALLLVVALLAAAAGAVQMLRTAQAWQDRAALYLTASQELGDELATTRAELSGAQAELDAVRAQLSTAQARIVALADEKAQLGDDREVQRQLVDYQQRVSEAAGQVALALDQCVQGQQELIGYLQGSAAGTAQYDPLELEGFRTDVEALCQTATEANIALQRELSR